jgi:type II secretory pathway pseudopilin PulG
MLNKAKQSAFTLIELGIIIAIVGIMSAVAVTQMMDLTGNAEEAVLQDYLQKLNGAAAQFLVVQGRIPQTFDEFMVVDNSELTPDNAADGKTVPLLYNKRNEDMCGTALPTTATLECNPTDNPGLDKASATYTLTNGAVTAVITRV